MQAVATAVTLFSLLFPTKTWFAPDQPWTVQVRPAEGHPHDLTLVLTDFSGRVIESRGGNEISGEKTVDLKELFGPIATPGTYVLWAVPKGSTLPAFAGTPLVIEVRGDTRRDAPPGPMVVKFEPLAYALLSTEKGDMTIAFYYDDAPHTVGNFVSLSSAGFYDGLTFHRVIDGFIIQGGDPRGDGTGGPGYTVDAEFSDNEMREGVIAMARQGDPLEAQGAMPRYEFANSAGSQFFICLNYDRTKQLDRRYTAFGKVIEGFDVAQAIAKVPVGQGDRPTQPPVMRTVRILPVEPSKNPYRGFFEVNMPKPTSQP
jgi:cyclophilin family peptidyl-prolyl cis-trans isomerase